MISEKKFWRGGTVFLSALLMAAGMLLFPVNAAAADQGTIAVTLPVVQTFTEEGGTAPGSTFDYTLKADDTSYPMPQGSADGVYDFTLTGSASAGLLFTYDRVGVYSYTIYENTGSSENYTYDKNVYTVQVYIKNAGNTSFSSEVIAKNQSGDKVPTIGFENSYRLTPQITPAAAGRTKTGDTSDYTEYIIVAAAAAVVIVFLLVRFFFKKRHGRTKQHK